MKQSCEKFALKHATYVKLELTSSLRNDTWNDVLNITQRRYESTYTERRVPAADAAADADIGWSIVRDTIMARTKSSGESGDYNCRLSEAEELVPTHRCNVM
jgi:hypothetical protein